MQQRLREMSGDVGSICRYRSATPSTRCCTTRAHRGARAVLFRCRALLLTVAPPPRAVNCNIFLCDDSDCGTDCRVVLGRDQIEVAADMGVVYGHVDDANGESFELDLEASVTYYIWTTVGTNAGHIQDTSLTLFDADGTTVL